MREGTKAALIENARPQMEAAEEAKAVMLGQTFATPLGQFGPKNEIAAAALAPATAAAA